MIWFDAISFLSVEEARILASEMHVLSHNGPDLYGVNYHRNSNVNHRTAEYSRAHSAISRLIVDKQRKIIMALEYCCECEQPTGRAGEGEDSLYDEEGPYCEECWDHKEESRAWLDKQHQRKEWNRLTEAQKSARIRSAWQ